MGLKSEPESSFPEVGLIGEFPRMLIGLSVEPDLLDKGLGPDPGDVNRDGRSRPFEVRRLSLLSDDDPCKRFELGSIVLSDFDLKDLFIWLIFFILFVTKQILKKNGEHDSIFL